MNYNELEKYLISIGDKRHAEFSKSLSNSEYISLGVKNPFLRQIIKEHLNDIELNTDEFKLGKYLEVDFIYFGLCLSRLKTIDEQLDFIKKNVKKAKSWAITDTLNAYFKKCTFEKYWDTYMYLNHSKHTYDRRFAYIFGLKFYKDERILNILTHLTYNEEYMVMMSEAWLLQTIATIYPNEIYEFLKKCSDLTLKRKTISKISDSFRFDEKTKNRFKSLR